VTVGSATSGGLTAGSAAIDRGSDAGVSIDMPYVSS
jgi:hypothetical protein